MLLSPIQAIEHPLFHRHNIQVMIKRDDLIHPIVSGNKWRKLAGNIDYAKQQGKSGILSFGGAYSNHIHALAYACMQHDFKSKAIIRGEAHYQNNYTLAWAKHWGMELTFVDRQTYRQRHDSDYLAELSQCQPNFHVVPEGGSNQLALAGMATLVKELNKQADYDTLMLPVGSGGTTAGFIAADKGQHNVLAVAVLKQADYLRNEITALTQQPAIANWQLLTDFHRGGYGKFSNGDCLRLADFIKMTGIPFEPIYSGKMLLAFLDLIEQGYFPAGHRVMLLHTGGIQGLGGQVERKLLPEPFIKAVQSHLPLAPQAL